MADVPYGQERLLTGKAITIADIGQVNIEYH